MREPLSVTIEAKVLGRKTPEAAKWQIDIPADQASDQRLLTLREIVTLTVTDEVASFHERQRERRLARVMTRDEIERGAATGKVDAGGREPQEVALQDAIDAALQAFTDRLYLVFHDGAPVESLDTPLTLHDGSHLTFVRLVALIGG